VNLSAETSRIPAILPRKRLPIAVSVLFSTLKSAPKRDSRLRTIVGGSKPAGRGALLVTFPRAAAYINTAHLSI
jgi:hypothetical protein